MLHAERGPKGISPVERQSLKGAGTGKDPKTGNLIAQDFLVPMA